MINASANRPERIKIARNWLPRYTGMPLDKFGDYILLTNFYYYLWKFAEKFNSKIYGKDKPRSLTLESVQRMWRPLWTCSLPVTLKAFFF